jgi:hypothetical protein
MANKLSWWLKEPRGTLSQREREVIQSVEETTHCERIDSVRYDPFFSYGAEEINRYRVRYIDGREGWLIMAEYGNTDGCGLEIISQDWDGICETCGHDWFRDCRGNCTCLSCNAYAQNLPPNHQLMLGLVIKVQI